MIGEMLGHYRILGKVGSGGMGEVYRARDEHLKRDVAVKLLSPQSSVGAEAQRDLLHEARAASALNDPHICTWTLTLRSALSAIAPLPLRR
jgi:eukaryotic-like serine/threonine-protein kinase